MLRYPCLCLAGLAALLSAICFSHGRALMGGLNLCLLGVNLALAYVNFRLRR